MTSTISAMAWQVAVVITVTSTEQQAPSRLAGPPQNPT